MENVLDKIVREAEALKLTSLANCCYSAREIVSDKSSLLKWPAQELRSTCLSVFELALAADLPPKLNTLSIAGIQWMLRDRLFRAVDSEEPADQLPAQVCKCIKTVINQQKEPIQLELLSLVTELSSETVELMTIDTVKDVISMCVDISSADFVSNKLMLAIEVTTSQTVFQYCNLIMKSESGDIFEEELFPLLSFFCDQIKCSDQTNKTQNSFLLKCVHSIFSVIPNNSPVINQNFVDFIWQNFVPLLIKLLTFDSINKLSVKKDIFTTKATDHFRQIGRGSESLSKLDLVNSYKHIYSIASELIRHFARISSLRPVLESLYHRILLYPPVEERGEALKFIYELMKQPEMVLLILSDPVENFGKSSLSKDLDLLRIIIDFLEECSNSTDYSIVSMSIFATVSTLASLELICQGIGITNSVAEKTNKKFEFLESADFKCSNKKSVDLNEPQLFNQEIYEKDQDQEVFEECKDDLNNIESDLIQKDMKNFHINSYKNKLSEILKSDSSESADLSMPEKENKEAVEINSDVKATLEDEKENDQDKDYDQESYKSEETEGPEEDSDMDVDINSVKYFEIFSQLKKDNENIWIDEMNQNDATKIRIERENARNLIKKLQVFLPNFIRIKSCIEADQALQLFASNYCKDLNFRQQSESLHIIINADGIYLASYYVLLLNFKLSQLGYFTGDLSSDKIPLTEVQFIEQVQNSGVLIYISATFLAELYQQSLLNDFLLESGLDFSSKSAVAIINLLTDIDGLDSCEPGAQQLSDYRRLERATQRQKKIDIQEEAGHKLVRRVLTAFWDSILNVLASGFKNQLTTQDILRSLEGLQVAAKLCITLGLQAKCGNLFELFAITSNPFSSHSKPLKSGLKMFRTRHSFVRLKQMARTNKNIEFCTSHLLSMQMMLSCGLEIGSHCQNCWKHVFECCFNIMQMEHHHFLGRNKSSLLTSFSTILNKSGKQNDDLNLPALNVMEDLPGIHITGDPHELLANFVQDCIKGSVAPDGVLKGRHLELAIELLSQIVDKFFDDAAQKLNLKSLSGFLQELSLFSRKQMSVLKEVTSEPKNALSLSTKCLAINRLSDTLLRCFKSGRPLIHMMKCWFVVSPHLIEAVAVANSSCSDFQLQSIATKSVSTVHQVISVSLSLHSELQHFHYNESLFKPLETIMLLELCDLDTQELIISLICEFVEGTPDEIKSGWRSLFGSLRALRLPVDVEEAERTRQLRVILDIFEAFLHTDNLQVFANAACDCLLCLLRLVKDDIYNEDGKFESSLCLVGLKYLYQFSSLLSSMYQMPGCPIFLLNKRFIVFSQQKIIELPQFIVEEELLVRVTLDQIDRPVKILHVWFMLLDGIAQSIEFCTDIYKNQVINLFFYLFKALAESPGLHFAVFCINHILLPTIERWFKMFYEDFTENNLLSILKHLAGLTADVVVEHFEFISNQGSDASVLTSVDDELLIRQSLLVYINIIANEKYYHHSLVKLSSACLRHILLSSRQYLSFNNWSVACLYLSKAHQLTIESIESLVESYCDKSTNFFDELNKIKVISVRKSNSDCTHEQLCRMAQQIFLVESQRNQEVERSPTEASLTSLGDDRSFTLVVEMEDQQSVSIQFRDLVIQLITHQHILQTISSLILNGNHFTMNSLVHLKDSCLSKEITDNSLLCSLNKTQLDLLLSLLEKSQQVSNAFDERFGLKFLLQKICHANVSANLYQISSLAWSVTFLVYFTFLNDPNIKAQLSPDSFTTYKQKLKQMLISICESYCECVCKLKQPKSCDEDNQKPFFFLLANSQTEADNELAEIIRTAKEDGSSDTKCYKLASEEVIENVVFEYKRLKCQHAPLPPTPEIISNRIKNKLENSSFNGKRQNETEIEKENKQMLIKDCDASQMLLSQVILESLDLHLSLPDDQFNLMVPEYLPAVETLIIFGHEKEMRNALANWISRIAKFVIYEIKQD